MIINSDNPNKYFNNFKYSCMDVAVDLLSNLPAYLPPTQNLIYLLLFIFKLYVIICFKFSNYPKYHHILFFAPINNSIVFSLPLWAWRLLIQGWSIRSTLLVCILRLGYRLYFWGDGCWLLVSLCGFCWHLGPPQNLNKAFQFSLCIAYHKKDKNITVFFLHFLRISSLHIFPMILCWLTWLFPQYFLKPQLPN